MHKIAFSSLFNKFVTATAILAMVLAAVPALPVAAASITVNITSDEYVDNTNCSLREAIIAANTNASFFGCTYTGGGPDDIITLASGSTYTLSRVGTTTTNGDLDVGNPDGTAGNLTIQTSGATNAIIDASGISNRVMEVDESGNTNLTLTHITLTGGNSPDGAGLYFAGDGTLTLSNSTVSGNTATGEANCGAGVFNSSLATVIINNSTIENNTCTAAGADGAGLLKASGGSLTITNSTFYNNTTPDYGGGVRIDIVAGTATISNSTFVNNVAGSRGGGLQVKSGTVTVSFSTFSGNSASYPGPSTGGAVQATGGSITVLQSILANSLTNAVTGADCDQLDPGTVAVTNSLVENNSDCTGTIVSSADPVLGSLADNGGPTMTLALLPGSPAINIADDASCPAADQRGISRPQGAHCDLGAYEFGDEPPAVASIDRASPNPSSAASVNFTVTFSEPVTGVDAGDFVLTTTGVTGASITDVSGSGSTYTVTVNTGTGDGTIRLDVVDDDSIHDTGGNALGGTGAGNGNFSAGQVYTVKKSADIDVVIGGNLQASYNLDPFESTRDSYVNVDDGPAKVVSTNDLPIISSERINLKNGLGFESYTEFLGLPASKLSDTYIFPWYNNATSGGLSSQLRIANVGNAQTTVTIKVHGVAQVPTYILDPNQSERVTLDNVDNGPVEVKSSGGVPIIASLRINLKDGVGFESYTEFLGQSASSTVGTKYVFPWYNNATAGGLDSQLRFGNVGNAQTTVTIKVAGVAQVPTYTLDPNESARVPLVNVDNGPVEISSSGGVPIIAAMRANLKNNVGFESYSEFIGLPGATLTETRYLFPWYNNATSGGLSSQLRFANVGNATTTVTIKVAGIAQDTTYTLDPDESARVDLTNVDNGPIEVISSGGVPIIASMRVNLKSGLGFSSYSEFIGLSVGAGMPGNELSPTYWFPWYNNLTAGGLSSQLRFGLP